ncbi:MAG: sulfite exporter TauE/SafE family protein [Bryobacteraceae bacterium]
MITVPVMFQFGIDARVAVATNMFALTFMSLGGTLPFLRTKVVNRRRLPLLIVLTLFGSAIGAMLLLIIPSKVVPLIVSTAIIGLAVFSMVYRRSGGDAAPMLPNQTLEMAGYVLTFLLGIYGGLFSGGYVTILTAVFVATFRMTFIEAIATTKLINVFSSGIATAIFMGRGLVDYRLGAILGVTMFGGALLGARYARRLSNLWLRRIYLAAVWALGLKTLLFDVFGHHGIVESNPAPGHSR